MIESLVLLYLGLCWLVFVTFHLVKPTTWTVLTAVVVGFFSLGYLLLMMNLYQPFTAEARFYFATTPIVANINGHIVDVPIKANQPLKRGDVMVRIEDERYRLRLEEAKAAIAAAQRAAAFAELELKRNEELFARQVVSAQQRDAFRDQRDLAVDAVQKAQVVVDEAENNLAYTQLRAPTDGYVTQLFARPGLMSVSLPFMPLGVFVHDEPPTFTAAFKQNVIQAVDPGDRVEVIFPAVPGRIFHGRVNRIMPVIAEGQLLASGQLGSVTRPHPAGRVPVVIDLEAAELAPYKLPGGAAGEVVVYTGEFRLTGLLRRVLLRMRSWENYVFAP